MIRAATIVATVLAIAGSSLACATKKQLRTSVGEVNDKVAALSRSIEDIQKQARRVETRVADNDARVSTAAASAQQAGGAAREAAQVATAAGTRATSTGDRLDAMEATSRRLVFEIVLREDDTGYTPGQTALLPQTMRRLDRLVEGLGVEPKNLFIEIEGHTDSVGSRTRNRRIGLERAQAVQRYLHEQHRIPLHKMSVISFGADNPLAPNTTKDGRARNRRIVVKVLA